jgi:hypothetical protein
MLNISQDVAHTRILPKQIKNIIRLVVVSRPQEIDEVMVLCPFHLSLFELPS